jgi:hypothetical protein
MRWGLRAQSQGHPRRAAALPAWPCSAVADTTCIKYYSNGRYIETQKFLHFIQMVITCRHQRSNDADFSTTKSAARPSAGTHCVHRFAGYQQGIWDSPAPASPRWHLEGDKALKAGAVRNRQIRNPNVETRSKFEARSTNDKRVTVGGLAASNIGPWIIRACFGFPERHWGKGS